MGSIDEIQQVCRLCLDKDEVNIPIFDESSDARQTFLKISACLPVKVSRDDNLPKNICDGCSCKLDMLYVFRNTSVDSEKQLIQWLNQAGLSVPPSTAVRDGAAKPEILVKQEAFDSSEMSEAQNYLIQQQKLTYSEEFAFGEVTEDSPGDLLPENEEPSPKRARRSTAKRQPVLDDTDDDEMDSMHITKAEADEDDSDDGDQADYGDTASADDQPGPSGVNRSGADAPTTEKLICTPAIPLYPMPKKKKGKKSRKRGTQQDKSGKKEINEAVHCENCDRSYPNNVAFALHSKVHNDDGKYSCHLCEYRNASKYHIEMHIKAHEGTTKYKCEICQKAFTISTYANEHKYFHTGEKPFQCEICGKHFMFSWFLASHRRTQHWEIITGTPLVKYDCTICQKHYTSSSGLRRHNLSKHNSEGIDCSALCDICGKSLSSKEKLKFHRRAHIGYKPFTCEFCSKGFTKKEQLKEHERVHTGEKPYICNFCGKGFTQRSPLRIHERIHTGEKPYVCRYCEKGFISKGAMDTHMKACIQLDADSLIIDAAI